MNAENIIWHGHDTFEIRGKNVNIFTDPFQIDTENKADIILITHSHYDHCSPDDISKLLKSDTEIIASKDCKDKISGNVTGMAPGDSAEIKGVNIEAVHAYNIGKDFHPKENNWLGFIFEIDGTRYYLSGDTDFIPEMKNLNNIDIALIPVSGTYVMTAKEAVEATLAINPKLAIPMHYGAIVGSKNDAIQFKEKLEGKVPVKILNQI
jgi:L-ascorbate metabolism protein UlaG (beta-lactamase superfamily)